MTPFRKHLTTWANGCGAAECAVAHHRCFARGSVPCDVLFIGEAPGPSEDILGQPFVGPAGQLLDRIVRQANLTENRCDCGGVTSHDSHCYYGSPLRLAFTNLVLCIPREDDGTKAMEPTDEQVRACQPRLLEFVKLCNPRLIVTVGKVAQDWLDQDYKHCLKIGRSIKQVHITHPAALLRQNEAQLGLGIRKCVITLQHAVEELQ